MRIAILAPEPVRVLLEKRAGPQAASIFWAKDFEDLIGCMPKAEAYLDFCFEDNKPRREALAGLLPAKILVNWVEASLVKQGFAFTRFNGWDGFLERPLLEAALADKDSETAVGEICRSLGWELASVEDLPGLVSARILACIFNEAHYALEEGVASSADMDLAMRLGVNYPQGPLEWGSRIGWAKIHSLLEKMAEEEPIYRPSPLLSKRILDSSI